MGRLKKAVRASRTNGASAARKKAHRKVAVLAYRCDSDEDEEAPVTIRPAYRSKPPKGYFYEDELYLVTRGFDIQPRVRFEDSSSKKEQSAYERWRDARDRMDRYAESEKKAVMLLKEGSDAAAKVAKVKALYKRAKSSVVVRK